MIYVGAVRVNRLGSLTTDPDCPVDDDDDDDFDNGDDDNDDDRNDDGEE